jgi:hypothetical protein
MGEICLSVKDWVEIASALTIPIAILGVLINRIITKKGIGVRSIQWLAVATFPPLIVILALERALDGSAVAALVGAVIGYLFSNISDFDRRGNGE